MTSFTNSGQLRESQENHFRIVAGRIAAKGVISEEAAKNVDISRVQLKERPPVTSPTAFPFHGKTLLLPNNCRDNASGTSMIAELAKINALPGPQIQLPASDRD